MKKSSFDILNNAKTQILESNDVSRAGSLYSRAISEGIPGAIVGLHQLTKGYMLLPMAEGSPVNYFEKLKQAKSIADSNEKYRIEYTIALDTLVNFKELFLRDVALNYFGEVATCSWGTNYGRSLYELYLYLNKHIDDITDKDCYQLASYRPECKIGGVKRDLKIVEAYCLNLLLMYVTHKSTHYEGKSYTASTYDFGDYAYIQVKSHDNYSHNAVARPRLHQIMKEAYYGDFLKELKELTSELKISVADELKKDVSRLVYEQDANTEERQEYYKYVRMIAKDDPARRSFFSTFGSIYPGYRKLIKPILKTCLGAEEVGSFELEQPLTRKRWLGVCNMIAWANDWSIEMVRVVMFLLGCCGIGILIYFGLFLAMKSNFYLPNFQVDKHM